MIIIHHNHAFAQAVNAERHNFEEQYDKVVNSARAKGQIEEYKDDAGVDLIGMEFEVSRGPLDDIFPEEEDKQQDWRELFFNKKTNWMGWEKTLIEEATKTEQNVV